MQYQVERSIAFAEVLRDDNNILNKEEWNGLHRRLLDENSRDDEFTPKGGLYSSTCVNFYAISGALIGIVSASLGLAWLDSVPSLGTLASIFSSMLWSFMTSFVSFVCFRLLFSSTYLGDSYKYRENPQLESDQDPINDEPSEYFFCFGVFFGFCSMSMAHDLLKGYPVHETLIVTGLPFVVFTFAMIICAGRRYMAAQEQFWSSNVDAIV